MDTQESRSALAPDDWWANWLRAHPVGGALLAGLLATHVTTMIGYYLVGIGLPELRWADFNGFFLGTIAEPIGSAGSFFGGFTLHTVDGLMFALLYAAMIRSRIPIPNTTMGGIAKGVIWGLVLGLISIGFLIPYVYLRKNSPSGFGGGLKPFSFGKGDDAWKLPAAVLLWHFIWGALLGQMYNPSPSVSSSSAPTTATATG
jgi:hypothetical protein